MKEQRAARSKMLDSSGGSLAITIETSSKQLLRVTE